MSADWTLTVREADPSEFDRVAELLAVNDLPHADLRESPGRFFVGRVDGEAVAAGGVELYDASALVRSVVVAESHRGEGHGTALCDELETAAVADGATALYVLTTTAERFFRGRGFRATDRETVPSSVRETPLFADHCPRSATVMEKRVD